MLIGDLCGGGILDFGKFGVKLIFNKNFTTQNNLSSFCVALEFFGDSFIIDADVVMLENILKQEKTLLYTLRLETLPKKNHLFLGFRILAKMTLLQSVYGKNYLEIPKQFLANDYENSLDFQTFKKL